MKRDDMSVTSENDIVSCPLCYPEFFRIRERSRQFDPRCSRRKRYSKQATGSKFIQVVKKRGLMQHLKIVFIAAVALSAQLFVSADLMAGAPTDQVRQTADQVFALLRNPKFKGPDKESQRRDRLRQIIGTRFNFDEMAKRSLGANWRRVGADEQKRFIELFTDLLERSYAGQIESYNGEKIVYGRENVAQDQAEVDTKVVDKKGQEFTVNYKLHSNNGDWRVYDVVIDNISLVNNYRSQFNRILAKSSFNDLLKKLEAKSPEIQDVRTQG